MDYVMNTACVKGKKEVKLIITPTNSLEREFFNNLFTAGTAVIETIPNSEDIIVKEKPTIVSNIGQEVGDDLPF